ncbi:hypothetical protein A0O34_00485 [Chryseobacterium glaciei]|uniref:DUF4397 domain-containing protein n=1 Tax=Chryseobacterium glaciei TaxID=1685010 RepID=A0A172XQ43_9FLAO|nr:DUF4397 domain-containing protein [Chryseobacterium glaciei]ANF49123.1 hypothetical protein A0O34_00485 [Chryseobacterium glaciei]
MKNIIKKISTAMSILLILLGLSSCEKDDVDEYGSAQLKIVNAAQGSSAQNFYLLGNLLKEGLGYTEYSDYISVSSGNRLSASFRDQSSESGSADGELWMANTKRYTAYLVGSGSTARIKQYEDDLSSPSSGKAKVKFIHLSDGIPSDIRIRDASGNEIVNNLSRNIESGYKTINPGTFSFSIYGTGSGNLIKDFEITDIQEGKIYTIYFSGESSSTVEAHRVIY